MSNFDIVEVVRVEDDEFDEDFSYKITVNGSGGYGSADWVMGDNGEEMLFVRTTFGEFMARDGGDIVRELRMRLSSFKNVKVNEF